MAYHQFETEDGPRGSFEVFYWDDEQNSDGPGWYWQQCFPGCLPDGDASGPFETEEEAIEDAQDF